MKTPRIARRTMLAWLATSPALMAQQIPNLRTGSSDWGSRVLRVPPTDVVPKPPVITCVRLHPAGQMLAAAGDDHIVRFWDLQEGKVSAELKDHGDWVRTIAFSPNGETLATGGNDRRIVFWDVANKARAGSPIRHRDAVVQMDYSTDGNRLAIAGFGRQVAVYNSVSRQPDFQLDAASDDVRSVAFSPDDRFLAAAGRSGNVRVWDLSTEKVAIDWQASRRRVRDVAFSADGQQIATAAEDGRVKINPWQQRGEVIELPRRAAKVFSVRFLGVDQIAASGSDNIVRLWSISEKREVALLTGHLGTVITMDSNPNLLVTGSYDTTIRVWSPGANTAAQPTDTPRVGVLPNN